MVSNKVFQMKAGVFIDYSNLFWAENEHYDWTIDYLKLKDYLRKRYRPLFYNFYCAKDTNPSTPEFKRKALGSDGFYSKISGNGYNVIQEPLKYIKDKKEEVSTKGDRDSEIITDITTSLSDIGAIILFSGDGDFLKTIEHCFNLGKYVRIYSYDKTFNWKIRTFVFNHPRCNFKLLDELKSELQYVKKKKIGGKFSTTEA
ncbi:MAG: NYN domain-containing protein [Candidatus Nealsonbacteria bacterium]